MIFAGDGAQLPPIQDTYHGNSVQSLMTSDLLKVIAPIRIELNVCKRSDLGLHNFGLLCRSACLSDCMNEARRVFQAEGEPAISLTIDNARRKHINQECNRRLAPKEARLLEGEDGPILLYKGTPLIGIKTNHGITNAIWYSVTDIADELHLCSERGEQICPSYDKAAKVLTLRHAMTVHKSQSRTLDGHVHICPGNKPGHVSPYWSLKHRLVAASRARSLPNLSIE